MDNSAGGERKVFPRWRSLGRTPSLEVESAKEADLGAVNRHVADKTRALYEKWRETPTLENAVETIDAAVILDQPFIAIGPAKFVLDQEDVKPAVAEIAQFVISGGGKLPEDVGELEFPDDRVKSFAAIRNLKKRLINEPRNGLLWLEKARLHTLIGDVSSGEHAILRALASAPNNRFVLRGFARFMIHVDRMEDAHDRLIRTESLAHDPWLQSSEIALADAVGLSPKSTNYARDVLRAGRHSPAHLSELAAALGTLEANSGARRRATSHFRQSLIKPNENTVSQALWARDEAHLGVAVKPIFLHIDDANEARVLAAMADGRWEDAALNCVKWLADEQFSVRAAMAGSYIASSFLWDQRRSIQFCDRGLMANPDNPMLLNNKLVSLARLGEIQNAKNIMKYIFHFSDGDDANPVVLATRGLLSFRDNKPTEGRRLYVAAMDIAKKRGHEDEFFRVQINWIYEEARAGTLSSEFLESLFSKINRYSERPSVRSYTKSSWGLIKNRIKENDFKEISPNADHIQLALNLI